MVSRGPELLFINGVTTAALYLLGKTPCEKERLASLQMSSEKLTDMI